MADAVSHAWIFIVLGLTSGCAYALTASGIVTVYRGSGVLNFSHCAVGMAGAYGFYAFYGGGLAKWPVVPAIIGGIVFSILLNLIIYLLIMRRLIRATQLARVVATIGVLIILQGLAAIHYGTYPIVVSFLSQNGVQLGSATLAYSTIVVMVALAVATISLWAMFRFTRLGLAATALQERPDAARALGISATPVGVVVWATGGALAAVAAILLRMEQTATSTTTGGGWNQDLGYGVVNASNAVSGSLRVASNGGVTGQVTDSNSNPISNATVTINGSSVTTAGTGLFRLGNFSAGTYPVQVSAGSYPTQNLTVTVPPGADAILGVTMGVSYDGAAYDWAGTAERQRA